jgi:glutamate dehydrogenase/leucine dehydrogenase
MNGLSRLRLSIQPPSQRNPTTKNHRQQKRSKHQSNPHSRSLQHPSHQRSKRILHDRGILVVPNLIANAGGLITAAVEYKGGTEKEAFKTIEEKIAKNTKLVLDVAKGQKILPRTAAEKMAKERVLREMEYRGKI